MTLQELFGIEFDWFGCDLCGRYAVFLSAGSGRVPRVVAQHVNVHRSIGDLVHGLEQTRNGWEFFATIFGLFVYGWEDSSDLYVRKDLLPGVGVDCGLAEALREVSDEMPRLDVDFSVTECIDVAE